MVIVNTECFKYANDMLKNTIWSSGCGTVGRVVASYTRDLRFESSHQQYTITCIGKKKVKKSSTKKTTKKRVTKKKNSEILGIKLKNIGLAGGKRKS